NATVDMGYYSDGFLQTRQQPAVSAANSGSGVAIPRQVETLTYHPTNKKLVQTETRRDGQNQVINITNGYDTYDNPSSRTEVGSCGTRVMSMNYNAFAQQIRTVDHDGYV